MGLTTKFLSNLFALFILSFCTANSQFTWSLPEVSQHEIVDFASINNPASGQTLISTTTRMFGAAVNSGSNNFNIIVGISGIQFMPTTSLSYRLEFSVIAGGVQFKLTLVYPTTIATFSVSYVAFRGPAAGLGYLFQYYNVYDTSNNPPVENLGTIFSSQTGYRTALQGFTSIRILSHYYKKCISNIMGFIGTSISEYKYSTNCQYKTMGSSSPYVAFYQRVTLEGDTLGTKLYGSLIVLDMVSSEIKKNTKYLQIETVQYINGAASQVIPTPFDSNTMVFFGLSQVTHKVSELFKYDFRLSTGMTVVPTTSRNSFNYFTFSKKTCTNPLQQLNKLTYQCVTYVYGNCSPEYVQLDIGNSTSLKIYSMDISKSNRFLVICWTDKVIVYKYNGTDYAEYQIIFMSTDCKDTDTTPDFSLLAIVGTNLFEVYTFDPITEKFINFFKFESQLGMNFINRQISLNQNGMKVAILSDVTAGGTTYTGHYYFVFNDTENTYVYKRFDASGAINIFLSADGNILYVTTKTKIVIYQEKSETILGNYIISYVIDTLEGFMNVYSSESAISGNQKVLAVYVQNYAIRIYHFNQTTKRFQQHHFITKIFLGMYYTAFLEFNYDGLVLIAGVEQTSILYYYSRNSLSQDFVLKNILGDASQQSGSGYQAPVKQHLIMLSADGKIVGYLRHALVLRLYYCGVTVQNTLPPDGKQLIANSSLSFNENVANLTYNPSQNISLQVLTSSNTIISQLQHQNAVLQHQLTVLESRLQQLQQKSTQQLQKQEEMLKNQENSQGKQNSTIGMMIAVIVGIVGMIAGLVKGMVAGAGTGAGKVAVEKPELEMKEENDIDRSKTVQSNNLNSYSHSQLSIPSLNSSQTTLVNESSLIKQPSLQPSFNQPQSIQSLKQPQPHQNNSDSLQNQPQLRKLRNRRFVQSKNNVQVIDVVDLEI